jgi:hypothetical protein
MSGEPEVRGDLTELCEAGLVMLGVGGKMGKC